MGLEIGLPSGTVTFLFTDIEGSTELLKRLGRDEYESLLTQHARVMRETVDDHGGRIVDTQGDGMFCAFRSARDSVAAAIDAQRRLAEHEWPEQSRVRVRMGLHSGEPKSGELGYVGIGVHRAARIGAAAHGGQVLLSETARALAADDLPSGVSLRDLGVHRLKDIDEPLRLYQVVADGLEQRFPPVRTAGGGHGRQRRLVLIAVTVVVAGAVVAAVVVTTESAAAKPVRLVADSLAVVDPQSGKPVGDVPLGFAPTGVAAGGNEIWVLNGYGRTAVAIDPHRLRVDQTVGIDGDPDDQYASGGNEWVAIPGGVDELNSDGKATIALWRPAQGGHGVNAGSAEACQPSITGNGRSVWVAEGRHFGVIDAASGSVLRKLTLPGVGGVVPVPVCYGLRNSPQGLLATRSADLSFGRLDPRSGSYTPLASNLGLNVAGSSWSGSISGAAGFGSLWLTGASQNVNTLKTIGVLSRLDLVSGQTTSQTPLTSSGAVAIDPTTGVWVLEPPNEEAAQVDPTSAQVVRTVALGHVANVIAAGHRHIWIGLASP